MTPEMIYRGLSPADRLTVFATNDPTFAPLRAAFMPFFADDVFADILANFVIVDSRKTDA